MADIKTLSRVQDVELTDAFSTSAEKLRAMLGGAELIPANPGETLHVKKITGTLSTATYTPGSVIPASDYSVVDVETKELTLKPFRKPTKLQDIQKRGYSVAVDETDRKVMADIQAGIKAELVTALNTASATATGTDMAKAAANAWAELQVQAETLGFGDVTPIFYVNPKDFAKCIGENQVFAAFGMQYIQNWAGLGNLVSTASVAAGTLYCAAVENLKVYFIPASNAEGFDFMQDESGVIAVCHIADATKLTYETVAWHALTVFPEYANFIVKATIAPAA